MPTLDWIGKSKVVNHHLEVPYHVLKRKYSFDESGMHNEDNESANMIIHGDNLLALKSLLPRYEGSIDCIYIDPPYNTANSTKKNQKWVYNDNVDDPIITKWLGEVVGDEEEDLSRHDKWLCMMYPRLRLLQKLLSDKGVIFISIDENEHINLRKICDEIFGKNCFVSDISWQKTYSPKNNNNKLSDEVETIVVYSKTPNWIPNRLGRTLSMDSKYKSPDNDPIPWKTTDSSAPGASSHQGMVYGIQSPFTGKMIYPTKTRCWSREQPYIMSIMQSWAKYRLEDINDASIRADLCGVSVDSIRKDVKALVLDEPLESARQHAEYLLKNGPWPDFYFTGKGTGGIARKTHLDSVSDRTPTNFWPWKETGHNDEAKKELKAIFGGTPFDTPKPVRLINRILEIATDKNSIILDSFAGSGTTAHAVLNMNKKDGGNRKFILVEMMDYADSITAERVKRVINGYSKDEEIVIFDKNITITNLADGNSLIEKATNVMLEAQKSGKYSQVRAPQIVEGRLQVIAINEAKTMEPGIPGSFSFYELGDTLMKNGLLNDTVGIEKIREYIYFTETKQVISSGKIDEPYFLGQYAGNAYYFYYQKDCLTTLDREFLHTVKTKSEGYIIYADLCTLSDRELEKYHITFKKIPRDISRL